MADNNDHNRNRTEHQHGDTNLHSADDAEDRNIQIAGDPETSCGCATCAPSLIQCCANPKLFTAHSAAIISILICSYVYFGGVLTTVERQFQLSSSESGSITITNDVVNLCLVVFASYFGHDSHRPRWIAAGTVLSGFGTLVLTMPHFASEPVDSKDLLYGKTEEESSECVISNNFGDYKSKENVTLGWNSTMRDECTSDFSPGGLGPICWIVIGNVLVGIGSAPLYPLITTYIDDAVGKRKLVSYMAYLFMASSIGPSIGFLLSAQATKLYVDFDRIPAEEIPDIHQSDPRWIGAWWFGFLVCGVLLMILGIPMFFYPRRMLHQSYYDDVEEAVQLDGKDDNDFASTIGQSVFSKKRGQNGIIDVIKGLMFAMKRLFTNVTLMFMALAASAETATIGIFATFSIKYLQTQFGLSPGTSGTLVGCAIVPCNIVSNLISAWIVRRFKLNSKQCALFVIAAVSIGGMALPVLMAVGCENPATAGITAPYYKYEDAQLREHSGVNDKLISSCNFDCQCPTDVFQPVCGSDGTNYISPCLAGCTGKKVTRNATNGNPFSTDSIVYTNCSCIMSSTESISTAEPGQCPITCSSYKLPLLVLLCALLFFIIALTGNPLIYILLRCVATDDRSLAVGMQSLITKLLGLFPSPVYFGAIINATCLLWQYTCDERGACWIYDIVKYRYSYFGTLLVLRIYSIFCYIIMFLSIKREKPSAKTEELKHPAEDLQLEPNGE